MDKSLSTVVAAVAPRRRHSVEFKRAVVQESLRPKASIAGVALSRGINANLLHTWRWQYRRGDFGALPTAQILCPVQVITPVNVAKAPKPKREKEIEVSPMVTGHIEILFDQIRVLVHGTPDPQALRCVFNAIRA